MTRFVKATALLALTLAGSAAWAGSASLDLVIRVVSSSGACGTSVEGDAVSVSCGSFASLPVLPPVSVGMAPPVVPSFVGGSFAATAPPFVPAAVLPQTFTAPPAAPPPSVAPERRERDQPEQPAQDEAPAVPVAVLPVSGPDNSPVALYSKGANLSSWRVVSNDNVQHVQLTIAW